MFIIYKIGTSLKKDNTYYKMVEALQKTFDNRPRTKTGSGFIGKYDIALFYSETEDYYKIDINAFRNELMAFSYLSGITDKRLGPKLVENDDFTISCIAAIKKQGQVYKKTEGFDNFTSFARSLLGTNYKNEYLLYDDLGDHIFTYFEKKFCVIAKYPGGISAENNSSDFILRVQDKSYSARIVERIVVERDFISIAYKNEAFVIYEKYGVCFKLLNDKYPSFYGSFSMNVKTLDEYHAAKGVVEDLSSWQRDGCRKKIINSKLPYITMGFKPEVIGFRVRNYVYAHKYPLAVEDFPVVK